MKIDNTNSKMRFNNYKDLSKYVIYVNPKQYLRMMRRRLERDRFLDLKCRPRKVYVPIAIKELSKGVIQHDDILGDLSKIKGIPSKLETNKNYEGLMNKPNCNNINIYINDPLNNSNQSSNSVNNTNSSNSFNNASINYNMNNNMSNWPSFYWNMAGYYNMNTSRYNALFPTYTTNDGIGEQQNNVNNSGNSNPNSSGTIPPTKNMDCGSYNQTSKMVNPNNPYYQNNNNTLNNSVNNSNQSNNTINNTNTTDNFNNANINYNMNNDMSNWPSFYWNMTGYYNMNTSRYNTLFPTYTTNDGVDQNTSNNNGSNNNSNSVPPSKNMDYSTYNQSSNMVNPRNPFYKNNNTLNNTVNNSNQSNNSINNLNSINKREEIINNNKAVKNEEFTNLVQGSYKGYDGLMTSQGFSSTSSTSSSYYNINSPSNMNHMYITNNFDTGSFSNNSACLTSSCSINESHSSMSSSGGFNVPPTEREKNSNLSNTNNTINSTGNNTINKREEIMNNYINLNNSPFSDCSIDTEVVCKTEQIYNINENGTVIDTHLGDEPTIGLNEPMYFNSNLISNIGENVIGNIIDSNCVASSCYLDTESRGTYNETHLQSILMDQNSINTTSTIINDHNMIFNTGNSKTNNSINTSASIHSLHSFEERIREERDQGGMSTRHSDSNDSSYIYRQLCDFF